MPIKEPILSRLQELLLHTSGFRRAVDRIFTQRFESHEDWLKYLWTVLQFASQLYADYALLTPGLNQIEASDGAPQSPMSDESTVRTEANLRERLDSALRGMPWWAELRPDAPFGDITGLRTADDFISVLTLHLPEAYMESLDVERWANEFSVRPAVIPLGSLIIGLEHMNRNHLLFVLPALQFAADETTWNL
jgi:hypothetical protein